MTCYSFDLDLDQMTLTIKLDLSEIITANADGNYYRK